MEKEAEGNHENKEKTKDEFSYKRGHVLTKIRSLSPITYQLLLLFFCILPTFYFMVNHVTGPYFGSHIVLSEMTYNSGHFVINPYDQSVMVNSQINFESSRTIGLTSILISIKTVTGLTFNDIMFIPIGFFLTFITALILIRKVTNSKILSGFFLLFISYNFLMFNMYSTNRTAWSFPLLYLIFYTLLCSKEKYTLQYKMFLLLFYIFAIGVIYYTIAIYLIFFFVIYIPIYYFLTKKIKVNKKKTSILILCFVTAIIVYIMFIHNIILRYVKALPFTDFPTLISHIANRTISAIITPEDSVNYPVHIDYLSLGIRLLIYAILIGCSALVILIALWRRIKYKKILRNIDVFPFALFGATILYIFATFSIGLPFRLEFIWLTFPIIIVIFLADRNQRTDASKNNSLNSGSEDENTVSITKNKRNLFKSIKYKKNPGGNFIINIIPILLICFVVSNFVVSLDNPPYTTHKFETKYEPGLTWIGQEGRSDEYVFTNLVLAYQLIMIDYGISIEHYWYQPEFRSDFDSVSMVYSNSSDEIESFFNGSSRIYFIFSEKDMKEGIATGVPGAYLRPVPQFKDVIDSSNKFDLIYNDRFIFIYKFRV